MSPRECSSLLIQLAQEDSIYDDPSAVDEVIYVLAWYLWDLLDQDMPDWTEALGRELDRLRAGITSQGSRRRFAAYDAAKANEEGGGPGWHIARTFQTLVLGSAPVDFTQSMDVSLRLAAMMKGLQTVILREAD